MLTDKKMESKNEKSTQHPRQSQIATFFNFEFLNFNCKKLLNFNSKPAFTLVEILIIVAILGILAAIIVPEYQNHVQKAKETAAKDNLRILRNAINLYAAQHNDIPPGYLNGDTTSTPTYPATASQLLNKTNSSSALDSTGNFGPYFKELPKNPFNSGKIIRILNTGDDFPTTYINDNTNPIGWIYKPSTKEVRLNYSGTDSDGENYYDY